MMSSPSRGVSPGIYICIIISPPCLASCRRCSTCEQKEEPGPRRFADFCAPTVPAWCGPETPGLQGSTFCIIDL